MVCSSSGSCHCISSKNGRFSWYILRVRDMCPFYVYKYLNELQQRSCIIVSTFSLVIHVTCHSRYISHTSHVTQVTCQSRQKNENMYRNISPKNQSDKETTNVEVTRQKMTAALLICSYSFYYCGFIYSLLTKY